MSREPNKFKPGDIVRVVRYPSEEWIRSGPVRVIGYRNGVSIDVETLDGRDASINGFKSYCIDMDCELDPFLGNAQRAVRDA
jgi:hypothetical protein